MKQLRIAPHRRYAMTGRKSDFDFWCDRPRATISMQNRNRGGPEVATVFNNDTPLTGPTEMVRVQSGLLTITTDEINWRNILTGSTCQ
jgi:hypothetical protein